MIEDQPTDGSNSLMITEDRSRKFFGDWFLKFGGNRVIVYFVQ
jgi:hypothetical protein